MSTTGDPSVGTPNEAALLAPPAGDREGGVQRTVDTYRVIGSPGFGFDETGATAAAIPGAELLVVDGMGHDLPREVRPQITDRITALVERAEEAR